MKLNKLPLYKLELIVVVFLIVAFISIIYTSFSYTQEAYIFPVVALSIGIVVSILQGVVSIKRSKKQYKEKDPIPFKNTPLIKMIPILLSFILYLYVVSELGFFVTTWIFLSALLIFLDKTKITQRLLVGTGLTIVMYLLFSWVLNVPLPRGILI
ncbi:tripartite tricarboxylate transporter TctB family protein [Natranaerobius trueperi]|uniref:DUF1468 domain-containing protein n=1 Tax=Natranaerobius trueperi TaxID=759412 RepID=A0A226C053_9FIRM|nr:tripartite tricarboxylate transporter TctB family protein [Natranaerobius trueperi]OWZ83750.1 hypothetical protein CDO51_06560 [Natranaerobius trueperi]